MTPTKAEQHRKRPRWCDPEFLGRAGGRALPARPDQRGSAVRSPDRANSRRSLHLIPHAYRHLPREPNSRRFLTGLGVSSLGDAMSTVTVAWLAVLIAPADNLGVFVGLAVAAYKLAGAVASAAPLKFCT